MTNSNESTIYELEAQINVLSALNVQQAIELATAVEENNRLKLEIEELQSEITKLKEHLRPKRRDVGHTDAPFRRELE